MGLFIFATDFSKKPATCVIKEYKSKSKESESFSVSQEQAIRIIIDIVNSIFCPCPYLRILIDDYLKCGKWDDLFALEIKSNIMPNSYPITKYLVEYILTPDNIRAGFLTDCLYYFYHYNDINFSLSLYKILGCNKNRYIDIGSIISLASIENCFVRSITL